MIFLISSIIGKETYASLSGEKLPSSVFLISVKNVLRFSRRRSFLKLIPAEILVLSSLLTSKYPDALRPKIKPLSPLH